MSRRMRDTDFITVDISSPKLAGWNNGLRKVQSDADVVAFESVAGALAGEQK